MLVNGATQHFTTRRGQLDIAKVLIQNGGEGEYDKGTTLHSQSRDILCSEMLIQNGADVNAVAIKDGRYFTTQRTIC